MPGAVACEYSMSSRVSTSSPVMPGELPSGYTFVTAAGATLKKVLSYSETAAGR